MGRTVAEWTSPSDLHVSLLEGYGIEGAFADAQLVFGDDDAAPIPLIAA